MLTFSLLRNASNGRVLRDINLLTDCILDLLGKLSLDMLLVALVLLVHLLKIVIIVLVAICSDTSRRLSFSLLLRSCTL